jgi:HSP20 family protein
MEEIMAINILLRKKTDAHDEVLFPEPIREEMPSGWMSDKEEGQLAVDVFETENEIVLRSAIAGVTQEDLDVFLHNEVLTVRGVRHPTEESGARFLARECHWGPFSRSVILPTDIDADRITAVLKDGVLRVGLPKIERSKKICVKEIS